MATSKCPSCGSTSFECVLKAVPNYNYQLNFIQCSKCGAVVGLMPYYDPGVLGHKNDEALDSLKTQMQSMQTTLAHILQTLKKK